MKVLEALAEVTQRVEQQYRTERRLLSFSEYLELLAADPVRYTRDASRYVHDAFEYFGRETVRRPWGSQVRFKLFDLPWMEAAAGRRLALVGQEKVQGEVFRALSNFVKEGRANRLVLLHGPNGSAKSTVAACIMAALEHYSTLDEGALYRFHWVFPSRQQVRGAIGFSGEAAARSPEGSYAHLSEDEMDARLFIELRDHPLFLLPVTERRAFVERALGDAGSWDDVPDWVRYGELSHKNRLICDALAASNGGSLAEVLRHVQIERYFISRRYRTGAVTVGPQLSVDAGERQVTADRSLGALPAALQGLTLFEAFGELVECSGGVVEFSDLLKRPLDAFKYLQLSVETGQVSLRSQNIALNAVMIGSANELQLAAFREHHEFESFRGRLELVRAPYLLSWPDEQGIYDGQIAPQVRGHVAPHATRLAAMFAVLTRLRKPSAAQFSGPLASVVDRLTVFDKLDLYGGSGAPESLGRDEAAIAVAGIRELYEETVSYPAYEGSEGASTREMRALLLDAAQDTRYGYLSPLSVLQRLAELSKRKTEYGWLDQEKQAGGYHDTEHYIETLRERLFGWIEGEMEQASGLVEEKRYGELFERYLSNVNYWVKGEKIQNPITGGLEDPDEGLMKEVEERLGVGTDFEAVRHATIGRVAAWAIDHPGERVVPEDVFDSEITRLRKAAFAERRSSLAHLCRDLVVLVREEGRGLDATRSASARTMLAALVARAGYEPRSAADAAAALINERYSELLS